MQTISDILVIGVAIVLVGFVCLAVLLRKIAAHLGYLRLQLNDLVRRLPGLLTNEELDRLTELATIAEIDKAP